MEIDVEKTHFWLSYFTDDQVGDKIIKHYEKTMELLNYLHLANYSSVDHLIIIFLVFSPETYPETEKLYFRRKKKEIEIRINMDYEKLLQATESETLQLIAQTYLSAISRFLSLTINVFMKMYKNCL
ncbi:MAG: hypothetical protein EAZ97_12125 [Bacteroidetes bacterium]|nr:MAG: hypothetical protein EAZ97_12125 [Bacteroidota bacterium]